MQPELPVPETDPDEIRRRADTILDGSEFRDERSVFDRAFDELAELIADAFTSLSGSGAGAVVAWVILAGLVAFIAWLVVRFGPVAAIATMALPDAVVTTQGPEATERLTADEWRAQALRLEAAGRLDDALRAEYRAVLAELIQGGWVDDVAGRTPGEYRREFAATGSSAADAFADVTNRFEAVWYGPDDATAPGLASFRVATAGIVRSLAVAGAPAVAA